jgi:hypothetical protein
MSTDAAMTSRRDVFRISALFSAFFAVLRLKNAGAGAGPRIDRPTLLSADIDVEGDWSGSLPSSALRVMQRMRQVCLSGVRLVSDRQPGHIRVQDHSSGPPAIWLHDDPPNTAWIIVDVGSRDWCKLAYQFGHELGHVLSNSWNRASTPQPPTQWLEEAIVEAFSIRGLGLLATSWEQSPPFAGDNAFSAAIRSYRQDLIDKYANAVDRGDLGKWLAMSRERLGAPGVGVSPMEGPAILAILEELERDIVCVADLGALNRWPSRSSVPIEEYLRLWETSCAELHVSGRLPGRIRRLFDLNGDRN